MNPTRTESALNSLVLAIVLGSGVAAGTLAQAQTPSNEFTRAVIDQRLAEQLRPRTPVAFDPAQFDKYVGHYQMEAGVFFTITRDGDHFFQQLAAQRTFEMYPESPTKFFLTVSPSQIEFVTDSSGNAKELVWHMGGLEQHATKVDDSTYAAMQAAVNQKIASDTPSSGTEASVRGFIASVQKGQPNFDAMTPTLAALNRLGESSLAPRMQALGALKSLTFKSVLPSGWDNYDATFELGRAGFYIAPLTADGKVSGLNWRILESTDPAVQARIKANKSAPGTEQALRHQIESLEAGQPDYAPMTPALAAAQSEQQDHMLAMVKQWGGFKSMAFRIIGSPMGNEVWDLAFEHSHVQAVISPVASDGKISILEYQYLP